MSARLAEVLTGTAPATEVAAIDALAKQAKLVVRTPRAVASGRLGGGDTRYSRNVTIAVTKLHFTGCIGSGDATSVP